MPARCASRSIKIARLALAVAIALAWGGARAMGQTVTVGDVEFENYGLVGVGRMPASTLDELGETFGSASSMAFDISSWKRTPTGYEGTLYLLPDRGYNVEGPINYRARLNRLAIKFTPVQPGTAPPEGKEQSAVEATLGAPILLTDQAGAPFTGLDPVKPQRPAAGEFPELPQGPNQRISIDAEGLVRMPDGSVYISDEYGPYIYRFSRQGVLQSAIAPPAAFIPMRNDRPDFSAEDPDPDVGRVNNRGFEGLTLTPGGKFLIAVLQSPTVQDGGKKAAHTRALVYAMTDPMRPVLVREHVITLPSYNEPDGSSAVAAQSEVAALSDEVLLMLCRDSRRGYGAAKRGGSLYRKLGLVDLRDRTNTLAAPYSNHPWIAPNGKLEDGIAAATFTEVIDLNNERELARFGLHNQGKNDRNQLSEKWESIGIVSALDPQRPDDFFIFVGNDNDFITQNGHQAGKDYQDRSGVDVDTMFLVFRVRVPGLGARAGYRFP